MAAKGQQSKNEIYKKLMEVFPEAFMADAKTMRIPFTENGERIEIKVALTAAKDILGSGEAAETSNVLTNNSVPEQELAQPTEQEIKNIQTLLEKLNMKG